MTDREAIPLVEADGWSLTQAPATEVGSGPELMLPSLWLIHDEGYQPTYNGRPSCPFCGNFVDNEETHEPTCVLVQYLASQDTKPEVGTPDGNTTFDLYETEDD